MKILLYNDSGYLKPMYDEDYDKKRKLKLGKVYQASIKQCRNPEFHAKYFKLIRVSWELMGERTHNYFKDIEVFRKTVEINAGWFDMVYSITRKEWIEDSKSIAFDSMDEIEFQELYDRVKDVLFELLDERGIITLDNFNKILIGF